MTDWPADLIGARGEARENAIRAGATPSSVEVIEVIEVEQVPISYLPGNSTRLRVKAVEIFRYDDLELAMDLRIEGVDDLCTGAAFLGAGGDPYIGGLMVKGELSSGRRIKILDPDTLDHGLLVIPTAMMGAPTVLLEKIPSREEPILALRAVDGGWLMRPCRPKSAASIRRSRFSSARASARPSLM